MIENLVFEGGASKGWAYIGAISELNNLGYLAQIKRFAGTSVGALFAGMLAANFTVQEIQRVHEMVDFSKMGNNSVIYSVYSILRYPGHGILSGDSIHTELSKILSVKNIPDTITLKELFNLTGKELVITVSNLNREKACYLHHAQYPNVQLLDALLCSIGIPLLFRSKEYDFMGTNDYYVDGGLVDNYPIWVFNDIDALYGGTLSHVERDRIPCTTLGLKLLVPGNTNSFDVFTSRQEIDSLSVYLVQLINTMMAQIDRSIVSASYIRQTVPIFVDSISFLKFDLGENEVRKLIQIGRESIVKYFSTENIKNESEPIGGTIDH